MSDDFSDMGQSEITLLSFSLVDKREDGKKGGKKKERERESSRTVTQK